MKSEVVPLCNVTADVLLADDQQTLRLLKEEVKESKK